MLTPDDARTIGKEFYGIDADVTPLVGSVDRSFLLRGNDEALVLKVADGRSADQLEGQAASIEWATTEDPLLPIAPVVSTQSGKPTAAFGANVFMATRYVDGVAARDVEPGPGFRRALGRFAARFATAMHGFDHIALHRHDPWNLLSLLELREFLPLALQVPELIAAELDRFEDRVLPALNRMAASPIHGDLNPDNIKVDADAPELIVGVFDFGDIDHAPPLVDLAVALAYQCRVSDPAAALVQALVAYHIERPLKSSEVEILPDLVAARCAQSLLMAGRNLAADPDNARYLEGDTGAMAEVLSWLEPERRSDLVDHLLGACSLDPTKRVSLGTAISSRTKHLAPSYRLSYETPVQAESAKGVWITTVDGDRILDAYNNVPHVGHGHPQVLAALRSQSERLNTNTRYVVGGVAEYAGRLAELLPEPLDTVFFTNSGSEANDLAYRIGQVVSGARAVVTSTNAYHGATLATAAMSPEEHDVSRLVDWSIQVNLAPHFGVARPDLDGTLEHLDLTLEERSLSPAMLIVDTVFSSEGIFPFQLSMLTRLAEWCRSRGGLFVADEVQAGFGRVGERFWGFGDVVPDIVTLGKPMGNGYPMGAVVTSRSIAEEFASTSTFFSTFAGSPVAAAVGSAVLDVIESEGLAQKADAVGSYLRQSILNLNHDAISDVRGAGQFTGVQVAGALTASQVSNEMRRLGILTGSTGPADDVLKIRPPLVFDRHHVDRVVETLAKVLAG